MAQRALPDHPAGRLPRFAVEVHQNEHLHRDATQVHAVVTATASAATTGPAAAATGPGAGPRGGDPESAVVVMVDCSGSMNHPPEQPAAARGATAAAVDALPDGTAFALVRGTHRAPEIHPGGGRTATGRGVSRVALRLWTPGGAAPVLVKQVAPAAEDLTGRRAGAGPGTGDYPTGSWGSESRDYHVCLAVPAGAVDQEVLAGRVSLVTHDPRGAVVTLGAADVRAVRAARSGARTAVNPMSPATRGSRTSPPPSWRASTCATAATSAAPPHDWGRRSGRPTVPATRRRPGCSRRWWTWRTS